ncbi:MAG: hypothetical protein ACOC2F_03880 [Bacteroidota bacterium]
MEYLAEYKTLLIIGSSVSILTFVVSLAVIPVVIINLSPDYFYGRKKSMLPYRNNILRYTMLILKNLLGYILILLGVIMLFIPGQGLLSITLGIILINFPGKKKLEYKFFSNKKVLRLINSIRRRAGKEIIVFKKSDRL